MKNYSITVLLTAMFLAAGSHLALGQYDDLYFDPDRDGAYYNYSSNRSNDRGSKAFDNRTATTSSFDDEEYGYYDDNNYDFQYSSRIRRFHRPYHGFGYYDPVYVDMFYYDPFFMPGPSTVLIYDNFYSFNSWNRWNRWNRWNAFGPSIVMVNNPWNPWNPWNAWNPWNPWGPRAGFGFNTWGGGFNTWGGGFNTWGGGFGAGGFGGGGFYASNIYCPPSWGGGLAYNTVNNVNNTVVNNNGTGNPGTYYGPRTSGTRPTATTGQRNIQGAQADGTPRDVTSHAPASRVQDNTGRVAPATDGRTSQSIAGRDQATPRSTATAAPSRSRTYDTAGTGRQSSPANSPSYNRGNTSTRSSGYAPQSQPRRDYTPQQAPSRSTAPATRSYDNNRRTAPSTAPRTAPSTAPRTAPSTAPRSAPRTAPSTSPSRSNSNWNSSPSRSASPSRSSGSWNSSSPSRSSSGFSSGSSSPSRSSSGGFSSGGSSRSSAPASRGRGN